MVGEKGSFHVKRLARASSSVTMVAPLAAGVFAAHGLVLGDNFSHVAIALIDREQLGGNADGARGIRYVNHGAIGIRGDLDRGVGAAGRRAADEQRLLHVQALHFAGDVGHFFERRGDQAGQADDVDAMLECGFQDVCRN
jgi:hypothetical protein